MASFMAAEAGDGRLGLVVWEGEEEVVGCWLLRTVFDGGGLEVSAASMERNLVISGSASVPDSGDGDVWAGGAWLACGGCGVGVEVETEEGVELGDEVPFCQNQPIVTETVELEYVWN
jgi:hypothetical protein